MKYTKEQADTTLARLEEAVSKKDFSPDQLAVIHDFILFWRGVMAFRYGFKAIVTVLGLLAGAVASILYLASKAKEFFG